MEPVVSDMPAFLGVRDETSRQEGAIRVFCFRFKIFVIPEDAAGGRLYPNSCCVEGHFNVSMQLL